MSNSVCVTVCVTVCDNVSDSDSVNERATLTVSVIVITMLAILETEFIPRC